MVSIFPLIVVVKGMAVPLLFLSSTQLVPALIFSLKVMVIFLLMGMFTALLVGLVLVTLSGV